MRARISASRRVRSSGRERSGPAAAGSDPPFALAYWGFSLNASVTVRVLAGLGTPAVAAVLWGLFASPRAAVPVPDSVQLAVQLGTFTVAVAALAFAGRPQLAWGFGIAAAVNAGLIA